MGSGRIAAPLESYYKEQELNYVTPCWVWIGGFYRDSKGRKTYGQYRHWNKVKKAHRFMYERCVGPIPSGMHLHHLCRNKACVNPKHLVPKTPIENHLENYSDG